MPIRASLLRRLAAVALALTAFVAAGEVAAADRPGRGGRPAMLRGGGGFGPHAMRAGPPVREQPAPAERAAEAPPVPQGPQGRPGRLTPDERRALRQQINDAGRNIYRAPPR